MVTLSRNKGSDLPKKQIEYIRDECYRNSGKLRFLMWQIEGGTCPRCLTKLPLDYNFCCHCSVPLDSPDWVQCFILLLSVFHFILWLFFGNSVVVGMYLLFVWSLGMVEHFHIAPFLFSVSHLHASITFKMFFWRKKWTAAQSSSLVLKGALQHFSK